MCVQAMERQNQELQHALSGMSKQLDQTNTNKETLLKDVSTARHVSLGLQSNTDQLQRKLMEMTHVITAHTHTHTHTQHHRLG